MARIRIDVPEHFAFNTQITLLGIHINFGGHLDNALLLTLVSEARSRLWRSLGYADGRDLDGVVGMVGDVAVQYKSEAHLGETMVIETAVRNFHKVGFDLVWRVSDQASGREVARGKNGIVCVDPVARKVAPPSARLLQRLQAA